MRRSGGYVDAEPDAAVALAQRCVRLPLVLRVAAELADDSRRLDLFDGTGDERSAVGTRVPTSTCTPSPHSPVSRYITPLSISPC